MFPNPIPPRRLPTELVPGSDRFTYHLPRSGDTLTVPVATPRFRRWVGQPVADTYGDTPIFRYDGRLNQFRDKPHFAELVILRLLEEEGWSGGWIDTFGNALRGWTGTGYSRFLTGSCDALVPAPMPDSAERLLRIICAKGGAKGKVKSLFCDGAFDVFCWRQEANATELLFVESKAPDEDIRRSQPGWLENALQADVPPESFMQVNWRLAA